MNSVILNFSRFFLLIAAQIFICNYVHLFGYLNPYLYIMALLLLPAQIPRWLQYLIAFATGYIIDIFLGSYGVQTFACVLMLFMRPLVEKLVSSKRKRRYESSNSSTQAGKMPGKTFGKMAVYILLLVFIHHLSVVLLETFTFQRIDFHILIAVGNTLFTSSLIIGIEQLFRIRKQKE